MRTRDVGYFLKVQRIQSANRRGGDQTAEKMKIMTGMFRKIKAQDRMDANNSWWVSKLLAADCEGVAPPRVGGYDAAMVLSVA